MTIIQYFRYIDEFGEMKQYQLSYDQYEDIVVIGLATTSLLTQFKITTSIMDGTCIALIREITEN